MQSILKPLFFPLPTRVHLDVKLLPNNLLAELPQPLRIVLATSMLGRGLDLAVAQVCTGVGCITFKC